MQGISFGKLQQFHRGVEMWIIFNLQHGVAKANSK
jgi:hypothetical protein